METIIGLLIVILPVIFKLIGKKLEQAGQNSVPQHEGAEPVQDWAELVRRHLEAQQQPYVEGTEEDASPALIEASHVEARKEKPKKKIMEAEKKSLPKDRIDPKKLVIYSEIMKPKYTE